MRLHVIKPNMTELTLADGTQVLFSYDTPVAARVNSIAYRTSTYYSTTTSQHINQWFGQLVAKKADPEFFRTLLGVL